MAAGFETLNRPGNEKLAYHTHEGEGVGVIFLPGFMSDMEGTKALHFEKYCLKSNIPFTRFDYLGHGQSSGDFQAGTIGRWCDDALAILDEVTKGPQILVGSSMGGWISLLAAVKRPDRVKGLVSIANGADFTEDLMLAKATPEMHQAWDNKGVFSYDIEGPEPFTFHITKQLIDEGRNHLVMRDKILFDGPVHLIHGMKDDDVPYEHSFKIAEKLTSTDVTITCVKEGGHRLSEPYEMQLVIDAIEGVRAKLYGLD